MRNFKGLSDDVHPTCMLRASAQREAAKKSIRGAISRRRKRSIVLILTRTVVARIRPAMTVQGSTAISKWELLANNGIPRVRRWSRRVHRIARRIKNRAHSTSAAVRVEITIDSYFQKCFVARISWTRSRAEFADGGDCGRAAGSAMGMCGRSIGGCVAVIPYPPPGPYATRRSGLREHAERPNCALFFAPHSMA
jgi:hypothetical protein